MCFGWILQNRDQAENFPPNTQRDYLHRNLSNTTSSPKIFRQSHFQNKHGYQQRLIENAPTTSTNFSEQADLLTFKYRLARTSSERLEFFENSITKWKAYNVNHSKPQLGEIHEKYKYDTCIAFRSIFYDYFNSKDYQKLELLLETYINLEGKINSSRKDHLQTHSINIGIYLDQKTVKVATSKSFREPEILQELSSEIAFLPDKIVIGKNAYQHGNHFNLLELLKSPPSYNHSIYFQIPTPADFNPSHIKTFTLTSEEIIAVYFEKLLAQIKSESGAESIKNAVITTPCVLNSFEKSRLQQAMKMAGCQDMRFLSSLLSTAVIYTGDTSYHFKTNNKKNEIVLVAQYSEQTFSMALVEVTPRGIITKTCSGLENMTEGQDKLFLHAHQLLYNNESASTEQENYVSNTYRKAIRSLSSEAQINKLDGMILIEESRYGTGITDILQNLFNNKLRVRLINEGPLAGAAFLSSRAEVSSLIIPPYVHVTDASRSNLVVSVGSREWNVQVRNKPFEQGVAFTLSLKVPSFGCVVNLTEVYLKGEIFSLIGQYQIRLINQKEAADREVVLRGWRTQDGVLTLDGELTSHLNGGYVRVESILRNEAINSSNRNQLLKHYESIAGDQKIESPWRKEKPFEEDTKSESDFSERTPSPRLGSIEEEDDSFTEETIISPSSSSINESPPEFPSMPELEPIYENTYHMSQVVEPGSIKVVEEKIAKSIEEALKMHHEKLLELADKTEPFTDQQIKDYHEKNLSLIKSIFNQVFSPIQSSSAEIDKILQEAEEKLERVTNSQLHTYLKRHEYKMGTVAKKLKMFALEGETLYSETMEELDLDKKIQEHPRLVHEAKQAFREKAARENIEWQEEFFLELNSLLEKARQDLVKKP